jgi:hypothetical protein
MFFMFLYVWGFFLKLVSRLGIVAHTSYLGDREDSHVKTDTGRGQVMTIVL